MTLKVSQKLKDRLEELKKRYPDQRSTVMPALYMIQEENGIITDEGIEWISQNVGLTPVHVKELATFYTMYHRKPIGKYHVQVCRTLACALCGAKKLVQYLEQRLKTKAGEITSDGMWSYEEVECLGSCGTGPMVEINDCYFENLTAQSLGELMDRIEKEKPDLRYSTIRGELGAGLKGYPRSQVMDGVPQ